MLLAPGAPYIEGKALITEANSDAWYCTTLGLAHWRERVFIPRIGRATAHIDHAGLHLRADGYRWLEPTRDDGTPPARAWPLQLHGWCLLGVMFRSPLQSMAPPTVEVFKAALYMGHALIGEIAVVSEIIICGEQDADGDRADH
jgi:hypothetical protein